MALPVAGAGLSRHARAVATSATHGYSGTPLPRKLGIKEGMTLALIAAPSDFVGTLGALPDAVTIRHGARGRADLAVWFPKSRADLVRRVDMMDRLVGEGTLWIAWPKKASGVKTDLTDGVVRQVGLSAGLVDSKTCAIDATFSGLRFTRRRTQR